MKIFRTDFKTIVRVLIDITNRQRFRYEIGHDPIYKILTHIDYIKLDIPRISLILS